MEVLVLDSRLFLVERCHMQQAVHHTGDILIEEGFHSRHVKIVATTQVVDEGGDDHSAVRGDGIAQGEGRAHVAQHGIQAILVTAKDAGLDNASTDEFMHGVDVLTRQLTS